MLGEAAQQLHAFMAGPLASFTMDLIRQMGQLLHGQQTGAALHEKPESSVQAPTLWSGQRGIAVRVGLGDQEKDGLLHPCWQHLAQHLEVERHMAVELRIGGLQSTAEILQGGG
jgi:hypothetical protein